jgi:hypothetical protein
MFRTTYLLLAAALAPVLAPAAVAQDAPALPAALPETPAETGAPALLKTLPRPPELPASLFAPPVPRTTAPMPIDAPYLVPDPLLDPPGLGTPGWFGGVELQVLKPHLLSQLKGTVRNPAQRANGTATVVALPDAPLDWTVAPRFFLGYRLPSGFGEFQAAYRFLSTSGTGDTRLKDGPAALNSRLSFTMIDLDYNSPELSLWPKWDMRWTLGGRILTMFYASQVNQSFTQAAAGNGIFDARQSNNLTGGGPHVALQLARHLGDSCWALAVRTDFSAVFSGSHLDFSTESTTLGPTGRPLSGETPRFGRQGSPMISIQAGLRWQPAPTSPTRFFLGYQFERFWALNGEPGTNGPPSTGQLWDQGIVLQATFRY